jgi:hypothetical protein
LPRGRLIASEERGDVVLLRLPIGALEPCQGVFAVAPHACTGVELWAIRWQDHEGHVVRQGEPSGRLGPAMVHAQDMQTVSEGLGEGIAGELEPGRLEIRPFQEEALAGRRLHGAVDVEPCEDLRDGATRPHAPRGEAPPADGQEADPAFVWATDPDGAGVRGGKRPLELFLTGGLERGDGLRLLWCGSGAALCASP